MPSRRSFLRLTAFGILVIALVTLLTPLLRPRTEPVAQPGPLVVVSMPTLRWADVDERRTPTLDRLADDAAIGNVATHAVAGHSCSGSVWATLSSGFRVSLDDGTPEAPASGPVVPCPPIPRPVPTGGLGELGGPARFPDFPRWRAELLAQPVPAELGLLGTQLRERGQCIAAAGAGAAVGAVRKDGTVASYEPDPRRADLRRCPITFVSFDGVDDDGLARIVDRLPREATLVVTGHADDQAPESLRAVLMRGPGIPEGRLTSASSRQPGLIRTTDLTALVTSRVSALPGTSYEGRIPVVLPGASGDDVRAELAGTARALDVQHHLVRPFFTTYVLVSLVTIGVILLVLQRDRSRGQTIRRSSAGRALRIASAAVAAVPVSTFLAGLVPWWRWDHPTLGLVISVLGWAAVLATVALRGPWRSRRAGPAGFLAATTALVLAVDLVLGGHLQLMTMMGLQPVYGGRLHGLGNVGFALTASGALLAASLLTGRLSRRDPSRAARVIAAMGIVTVAVDGHYALGDEAGGSLALVWGFGYLALKASGRRTTWRGVALIAALSAFTALVMATLDMLRPRYERSHIGDFLATLIETGDLTSVVRSTFVNNWSMLTSQWVNLGVPVLLLLAAWAARRPLSSLGRPLTRLERQTPLLRIGFTAIVLCWIVGFLTNDSGTSIPPAGSILIVPLVVLMTACAPQPPADHAPGHAPDRAADAAAS